MAFVGDGAFGSPAPSNSVEERQGAIATGFNAQRDGSQGQAALALRRGYFRNATISKFCAVWKDSKPSGPMPGRN